MGRPYPPASLTALFLFTPLASSEFPSSYGRGNPLPIRRRSSRLASSSGVSKMTQPVAERAAVGARRWECYLCCIEVVEPPQNKFSRCASLPSLIGEPHFQRAVPWRGARPISSPLGIPIATPPRLYRPAREEIARGWVPTGAQGPLPWRRPRPVISSRPGSRIVFYGKFPTLTLSSRPGKDTVLAGKRCRPARERTSSYPGTHIVPSGNLYRLAGEKLSSRLGNARSFSLQTCLFFFARGSGTL
jgi:hypothetical protein